MKVILLKDVPKLGRKNDVKEVPQGHAINLLIPRKLAVAATPHLLAQLEKKKQEESAHKQIADELIRETMVSLSGVRIPLKEKANTHGHLFSKVSTAHIVEAIQKETGVVIEEAWVQLAGQIKEVGDHELSLVHGAHIARCTLCVEAA